MSATPTPTASQVALLKKIKRRSETRCPLHIEDIPVDEIDDAWYMTSDQVDGSQLILHDRAGRLSLNAAGEAALAAGVAEEKVQLGRALAAAIAERTCPACPRGKEPGETHCSAACEFTGSQYSDVMDFDTAFHRMLGGD